MMCAPSWLKTKTQPIAVKDALSYLAKAPAVDAAAGREVQIGCPDVVSYGEMLDRMARAMIEGLATETVVTDPSGASLFDIEPIGIDAALRQAVAEELLHRAAQI